MEAEIQADYQSQMISAVCTPQGSHIQVTCFKKSIPLLKFAKKFYVLNSKMNSNLFKYIWTATVNSARSRSAELFVDHVCEIVWEPTICVCKALMEKLQQETITLGDVKKYFKDYSPHSLATQLKLLFEGVSEIYPVEMSNCWIERSVQKIMQYRDLCTFRDAADSFLELRNLLKLTEGDFGDIEKISNQVNCLFFVLHF